MVDVGGSSVGVRGPVGVGAAEGGHRAKVAVAGIERQVGISGCGLVQAVDAAAVEGKAHEGRVAGGAAVGGEGGRGGVQASGISVVVVGIGVPVASVQALAIRD